MADHENMTEAELHDALAAVNKAREEQRQQAQAINNEIDRRVALKAIQDADPKGLVIAPGSIPSAEVVNAPGAG